MTPTRILSLFLCFCLILEQSLFAQTIDLSHYFARNPSQTIPHSDKFRPLHLRYISYDNQANDFKILLDKGDFFKQKTERTLELEQTTQELMKYFFIGLSLPNEKFWVNLRPDSPDNILDPELEKTDIGRIFLEADLQLKKDTASFTSPQNPEGKAYWDKLYKKAGELFGNENITIPTITRPWIVPNEIIIREAPDNAYIYKATLKVMLEEDYLNQKTEKPKNGKTEELKNQRTDWHSFSDPRLKELNQYSTQLIKETIIPKLTYAVNIAKRYAQLRQVYYSLILAQWFKQKYGSLGSTRAQGTRAPVNSYVDQIDSGNLANLTSKEPYDKQMYFKQYQKSFVDGEYNLTEPVYTPYGQSIRRYVSGGLVVSSAIEKATTIIPANGEPPFTGYLSSASPILLNSQIATNTSLQRLAQNELKYSMLVKQYRLTIQKIEQEIKKVYVMDGSGYEDSLSVGARAAVKLKVLELLIDLIEGKSNEDINIVNLVVYDFLPTLQEHIYGAFLPIGTEIEIWAEGSHTKYGDPNYYDDNLAREIWTEVLDLPLGFDELIEFALPPSRSSLSQVAMIDSMIKIGLLPEGCFSLHISGGLPVDINVKDTVLEIASYFELAKALLYTSDKRIKYFASMWNPLAIKGTDSDVSKIEGKAPSFAIYNGEEMVRVEYRSGDVVVADDDVFSDYRKAITFIQITHGLMVLALTAAIAPQEIKNKFLQELLKTFDDFIREMDIWKEKIPEKYAGIKDLFGRSLTTRSSSENMKHIVDFRNEEKALFKELEAVADNLRENLLDIFADVEKNSILLATESVENLEIVKRIKAALPKEVRIGDMAKVFAPAGYDNYLRDIRSFGSRLSERWDISMLMPLIIGNLPERSSPFSYYQQNKGVLRNYLLEFNKRYKGLLERSAPLSISPQLVIPERLELQPMELTFKRTLLDSLVYRFRRLMNRLIFWRNRSEGEASLKEIAKQNHLVAKGPYSSNDNKNGLSSSSVELHDDKAKSQSASSAVEEKQVQEILSKIGVKFDKADIERNIWAIITGDNALNDEERYLLLDYLWDKKGIAGIAIPNSIKDKIIKKSDISYELYDFVFSSYSGGASIIKLKNHLSLQEEQFLWKLFHRREKGSSNRGISFISAKTISEYIKNKKGAKVLELGCGGARALRQLKDEYGETIEAWGIDMEISIRDPGLHLIEGDIREMRFGNDYFDIIYESFVMEYFQDNEKDLIKVISEIMRVLSPGGKFVFTDTQSYGEMKIRSVLDILNISYSIDYNAGKAIIEKISSDRGYFKPSDSKLEELLLSYRLLVLRKRYDRMRNRLDLLSRENLLKDSFYWYSERGSAMNSLRINSSYSHEMIESMAENIIRHISNGEKEKADEIIKTMEDEAKNNIIRAHFEAISSSPVRDKNNTKGGIAFNALPIQTESVASSVLGSFPGANAFKGDLDAEWGRIQDVFNAGIRPSIQRLSEYTAAVSSSPLAEDKIDQVRVMLADILRHEEEDEKLPATSLSVKELLSALENDNHSGGLQLALGGLKS